MVSWALLAASEEGYCMRCVCWEGVSTAVLYQAVTIFLTMIHLDITPLLILELSMYGSHS